MGVTQLYIELILIGLEASVWLCAFLVDILGYKILNVLFTILNSFASSLLLIGTLYVVGMLIDRFAELIFKKNKYRIRNKSGLQSISVSLVWKKTGMEKYSDYARSRLKILRASIINIPLILVSFIWYACKFVEKPHLLIIYILLIGGLFTYISWQSYNTLLVRYYNRAHELELNEEK